MTKTNYNSRFWINVDILKLCNDGYVETNVCWVDWLDIIIIFYNLMCMILELASQLNLSFDTALTLLLGPILVGIRMDFMLGLENLALRATQSPICLWFRITIFRWAVGCVWVAMIFKGLIDVKCEPIHPKGSVSVFPF